jgi:hypothetical protein
MPFSAEARARLRARLDEGMFTVVPDLNAAVGSGPVGWWLVEPGTATLLDEMEDGRHTAGRQTTSENKAVTTTTPATSIAVKAGFVQKLKKGVHRAACVIALIVGAGAGAAAGAEGMLEPIADAGEAVAAACNRGGNNTGPTRPRRNPGGQGPKPTGLASTLYTSGPESPSRGAIGRGGWDATTPQGHWPPLMKRLP